MRNMDTTTLLLIIDYFIIGLITTIVAYRLGHQPSDTPDEDLFMLAMCFLAWPLVWIVGFFVWLESN